MAEIHEAAERLGAALEVIRRAGKFTRAKMVGLLCRAIADQIEQAHPDNEMDQRDMLAQAMQVMRETVTGDRPH